MEQWEQEMQELSGQLNQLFPTYRFQLPEMMEGIMRGEFGDVFSLFLKGLAEAAGGQAGSLKALFLLLLSTGLLAALLIHVSNLFENRQLSDMAFYFIYLFLMLVLWKAFSTVMFMAEEMLDNLLLFMRLFMPVYFLAVGAASGVTTSLVYYQLILFLIYGVEMVLSAFLLPLIRSYVFLVFLNGLWAEEKLHMLLNLVKKIIGYFLKFSFTAVTGIGIVQSLITPVVDSLRMSALQKTVSMIPGVGSISGSVAELVMGSAVLVKNSIGVLAVLLLLLLCGVPMLKIWLLSMVLKAGAAVSGMVTDRRLTSCMDKVGEGGLLLLRTMATACGLFFLAIAIVAVTTSRMA